MQQTQTEYIVAPEAVPFTQAVEEFLNDLRILGRKESTIKEHQQFLSRLDRWLTEQHIPWQAMSRKDMHRFMQTIASKSASTKGNLGGSMRGFWTYAAMMEYVPGSPAIDIRTPKKPRPVPRALSRDQVRRLLAWLKAQAGRGARRDEALLVTALYTACRAGELAALLWSDIDFAGEVVTIKDGKTGGRAVALHPALADLLTLWRKEQAIAGDVPVFSLDGKPFNSRRVGKICYEKVSRMLGFHLHAHALRHTAATWALRNGAGLYNVSRMLGHADTAFTARTYIRADPTDSIVAVNALPGLEEW